MIWFRGKENKAYVLKTKEKVKILSLFLHLYDNVNNNFQEHIPTILFEITI